MVALEPLVVSEISFDNFGKYFRDRPAKVMSLLQHMSARIRQMQKAYVETCHALENYGDKERLEAEHGEWYAEHSKMASFINAMFPSMPGKIEDNDTPEK